MHLLDNTRHLRDLTLIVFHNAVWDDVQFEVHADLFQSSAHRQRSLWFTPRCTAKVVIASHDRNKLQVFHYYIVYVSDTSLSRISQHDIKSVILCYVKTDLPRLKNVKVILTTTNERTLPLAAGQIIAVHEVQIVGVDHSFWWTCITTNHIYDCPGKLRSFWLLNQSASIEGGTSIPESMPLHHTWSRCTSRWSHREPGGKQWRRYYTF